MKMKVSNLVIVQFLSCIIAAFILNPSALNAQIVGGNASQQNPTPASNSKKPYGREHDDKFWSLSAGAIFPVGIFSQAPPVVSGTTALYSSLYAPFQGTAGMGATIGYNMELSVFSSFRKLQVNSYPGRIGLLYGLGGGTMNIDWSNTQWNTYGSTLTTSAFYYFGIKIGPAFYLNPMPDMGIGAYLQIDPCLTTPGGVNDEISYQNTAGDDITGHYNVQSANSLEFNLNWSLGINFYYKALFIQLEYNRMHTAYSGSVNEAIYTDYSSGALQTITPSNYSFNSVLHTNIIKLNIGIRFGYGKNRS